MVCPVSGASHTCSVSLHIIYVTAGTGTNPKQASTSKRSLSTSKLFAVTPSRTGLCFWSRRDSRSSADSLTVLSEHVTGGDHALILLALLAGVISIKHRK